jgi:hypothetical protein
MLYAMREIRKLRVGAIAHVVYTSNMSKHASIEAFKYTSIEEPKHPNIHPSIQANKHPSTLTKRPTTEGGAGTLHIYS